MKTNIINIKDIDINEIAKLLNKKSFVMAIPTDTVYALCCNACDKDAVEKIYNLKNRDKEKPISLFIKNINELNKYIDENITDKTKDLLKSHWPGALTVVFKKKKDTFDYLTSNRNSIGIRIPDDKLLLDILEIIDFPLAQTSCNVSNEKECRTADEIYEKFGNNVDLIISSENNLSNKPSTIISIIDDNIKILRQGNIIIK